MNLLNDEEMVHLAYHLRFSMVENDKVLGGALLELWTIEVVMKMVTHDPWTVQMIEAEISLICFHHPHRLTDLDQSRELLDYDEFF